MSKKALHMIYQYVSPCSVQKDNPKGIAAKANYALMGM
jgi:hypothetical protein